MTGKGVCLDAKYLRGKSSPTYLDKGRFVRENDSIILVDGENSGEVFTVPEDGYMGSTFKQLWLSTAMYKPYLLAFILFYKEALRNSKRGASYIQECIVEREKADIPLQIQKYEKVYGITIESLVLTNNVEPYTGYLVTTWDLDEKQKLSTNQWAANGYEDKYVRKQKTVYVEISDITMNQEGQVSWSDNWLAAYMNVRESE